MRFLLVSFVKITELKFCSDLFSQNCAQMKVAIIYSMQNLIGLQ